MGLGRRADLGLLRRGRRPASCSFWEKKVAEPLIPLTLFRSVPLSAGVVLMVLMAFAFMGGLFFVTFYLQNVHGMTPVRPGCTCSR